MTAHWIDIALIGVVLLSMVVGSIRGLLYEVLSWLGWAVAYGVARLVGPIVAPLMPVGEPGSAINMGAAMVGCFVVALLAWGLLTWLLQKLVQASPLQPVDRALGAVFGIARGLLIGLIVAFAVSFTPWSKSPSWRESFSAQWLVQGVDWVWPVLPEALTTRLPHPGR